MLGGLTLGTGSYRRLFTHGVVAQLGERLNGIQEVVSSILSSSTRFLKLIQFWISFFYCMKLRNKMVEEPFRPPFRRDPEGSLFFCSYPETGHAEMAAASARAGRKILMVRFGGVKGGGREQFGGHRIAVFPELFHEGKGCGFLPLIFVENR